MAEEREKKILNEKEWKRFIMKNRNNMNKLIIC